MSTRNEAFVSCLSEPASAYCDAANCDAAQATHTPRGNQCPDVLIFLESLSLHTQRTNLLRSASLDSLDDAENGVTDHSDQAKCASCFHNSGYNRDEEESQETAHCRGLEDMCSLSTRPLKDEQHIRAVGCQTLDVSQKKTEGLEQHSRTHQADTLCDREKIRQLQDELHKARAAALESQNLVQLREADLNAMKLELVMAKKRPTPEESALQHENRVLVEMLVERQLQLAEVLEDNAGLQRDLYRALSQAKDIHHRS